MNVRGVARAVLAVALSAALLASASVEVDRGVAWLSQQVQANGSVNGEAASIATAFQARGEALISLKQLGTAPNALADAVSQESADPTEYLARKIASLAPIPRDVSAYVAALVALQNADGGFGGLGGYQSNPLDTAYALLALKAGAPSNANAISKALGYLTAAQATDGSFAINEQPSVYVTAYALQAFNAHAQTYALTAPIQSAKTWLVGRQTGGAYGSVVDNAIATLGLAGATTDTSAFAGAQNALKTAQAADGSWSGDPYLTAVAVRALAATAATPPTPTTGQVSGTVVDQSTSNALVGVQVQLSGPQSASTTTAASGAFSVASLTPGSYTLQLSKAGYTTVSLTVSVTAGVVTNVGTVRLQVATTTASLQGIVRDAATGQGVAGASVAVSGGPTTTTDASGAYQLSGLIPGSVTVSVAKSGYDTVSVGVTLSAGVVTSFSPSLYATGQTPTSATLQGKVVDRATAAAISGASVKVGTATATTNATGDFTLAGLASGGATLEVSAAGYVAASFSLTLAPGTNNVGSVPLDKQPASVRITGRVSDSATALPLGGATVHMNGTTLSATTNSNGNYTLDGVTTTQFTLTASAAGYQSKTVSVTLPVLADSTVDVALDKVPASGVSITRVSTDHPSYDPYNVIELDVAVQNATAQPASVVFSATVRDPVGNPVIEVPGFAATIAASTTVDVDLDAHLTNQAPGTYSVVVHAFDTVSGSLVAEGSASFVVNSLTRLSGGITINPPVTQAGTNQSVHLSANVANLGNQPIPAGDLQLTITLIDPDNSGVPKAHADIGPSPLSGSPLNVPAGASFDAQGNFYTVNRSDRRVLKITPDGQTTTVTTLPSTFSSPALSVTPIDLVADSAGNAYVLNQASEIFKVAPDGTTTRIRTNLAVHISFDRDTAGNFYVVHNNAGIKIARIDPAGNQTITSAEGFNSPFGVVKSTDGNLYVVDRARSAIARVTLDGVVTMFVTTGLNTPQGMTIDAAGNLYVANTGSNNVIKVTTAALTSTYATGLNGPSELAFDAQGNLYVTNINDSTVSKVPAGGGAAQFFAKTLVSSPQGMAYDGSNNLYVAGGSNQLVKLDPSDNSSVVSTAISAPRAVAVSSSGQVFVANFSNGTITRSPATPSATFASGLDSPYGLVFDAAGTLYASENGTTSNRIVAFDAAGTKTVIAESLINTPHDLYIAPNGDRYVLNTDFIASTPAAGGPVRILVRGGFSGTSFAPANDGGFFVAEFSSIKRVSPTGVVTSFKTGLPSLAHGIVADPSNNLLVGGSTNKQILRIDSAGNVVTLATLTDSPVAVIDDQASGVYVGTSPGAVVRVSAAGAVTSIATGLGTIIDLALDSVGNKLYVLTTSGIKAINLATNAVTTLATLSSHTAMKFTGSVLLATNSATLELTSITPQGVVSIVLAGFARPGPIATDGSRLFFGDNARVFSLQPGGYPQIVAAQFVRHLVYRAGSLYGTNGSSVFTFTLGVDSLFRNYTTLTGTLQGLAFRGDGLLSIAIENDSRVVTIDATKQIVASYAGISGPAGVVVDGAGNVFVAAQTNSQIVRISPSGKQASVFATGLLAYGLAFDSSGALHASVSAGGTRIIRFDSNGAQTVVASSTISTSLRSLLVSPSGIFVSDGSWTAVRKVVGTDLPIFLAGLSNPQRARLDSSGALFVASSTNGIVGRAFNGQMSTVAYGLDGATSVAFVSTGELLVGSNGGALWLVASPGVSTELTNLTKVFGLTSSLNAMAVNATGTIYAIDQQSSTARVEKMIYVPAVPPPPAGTVVLPARTVSFGGLATDSVPVAVDFGTWLPPYGGDFRLSVKSVSSSIAGEAVNILHVGPFATAQIVPAQATLPPGNSPLAINVNVNGADFTTLSKVDPTNISVAISTGVTPKAMGADAAGNIFVTTASDARLRRFNPQGVATTLFTLPAGTIGMRGTVPIDDQQNAYISGGSTGRDVIKVAPDGTATTIATLTETITSLVRASGDVIYALGSAHLFRIATNSSVTTVNTAPFTSTFAMTIDGKDNLYVQFTGNVINVYRPDGTVTNVLRPDSTGQPIFEYEGMNIAGDCADNLFLTPFGWTAVGQSNSEEHTLVQLVGKTGAAAQVLNGLNINPQLTDIDFIVYDRFTGTLLMWTDLNGGRMYRIPVTCGAINTDLHIVFPAGQPASGFSVTPKSVTAQADGSTEYVWSLKDVTNLGKKVSFTTTLQNLKLGGVAPVASSASLVFQNTFVAGDITIPLDVPTVGVDGMVDLAVSTDKSQYEANADVFGTVHLVNRDTFSAKSGTLTVEITDPQGVRLAVALQQAVTVAAGSVLDVHPAFNTGTYLSGSYLMKATLADATGAVVASGSAGFDIVAGAVTLISSVTTDKQAYDAFDTVNVLDRVRNVSVNAIATNVSSQVTVKDPSGAVVLSGSTAIPILVPQALKDTTFVLKLNAAAAGSYTVEEKLFDGSGALVETRTATFSVLSTADTGSGLRGSVTATKLVNQGDSVTITATVKNAGNSGLANLVLTFKVVNPATGALVQHTTTTIDLAQGAQQQVFQTWITTGAAAGTYISSAGVTFGTRDIALGQDTTTVGVLTPFSFAPRTNVALNAVVESNAVTIAGIVAPVAISIVGGEYRINAGGYTGVVGTVKPGDLVTVRVTAANAFNTTTTATLTVAGFSAPFSVTTVNPDTTPDPFAFAPQTNVPLASLRVSNTVTITGIDIPVPVSIVGGAYSINGGAFTSAAGTIANGDTVAVRLTSSTALGTTTSATLTVSNVSATFSVTTTAEDRTPDPFAFTAQNAVPRTSLRTSNTVTITGINVTVPISIVAGEYSVNGGAFTSAAGTVASGNTVTVRQTSSASFSTTTTARLTVSDFTANFAVTTEGEDHTPDAFAFNPKTNQPLATLVTSDAVTITGINVAVAISIAGGEYSINGGAFTSAVGTVNANDVVTVRQISSSSFATTTTATLTVSDVSAGFSVTTKSVANVTTAPTFASDARVLVLVSCKSGVDETVEDPPCTEARRSFLDTYLASLGVSHTIVTATEPFRAELRSGRYNTYWVSGGAVKLADHLAEEVREAAFRGETVVIDGVHDERNSALDEVVGIIYRGKPTGLTTVTLDAAFLPSGSFGVNGSRPIRVELTTALRQGHFNTGDPAIATNSYGYGKALLFAFDLTGTLFAQSASALLRATLDQSLDKVTPAVPLTFTGGAYVPLSIAITNTESVAVNLDVTATLPSGFTLAAGAPPATLAGSTVTWHVTIAGGATQTLDFAVRTPDASGSYSIPVAVAQTYGSTSVPVGTYAIAIDVHGLDTQLSTVIAQLQALALTTNGDIHARDDAVAKLQTAQSQIAGGNFEGAIASLIDANGQLDGVTAVSVTAYEVAIDNVLKEVERRWWSALPACPATPPCRS